MRADYVGCNDVSETCIRACPDGSRTSKQARLLPVLGTLPTVGIGTLSANCHQGIKLTADLQIAMVTTRRNAEEALVRKGVQPDPR